MNTEFESISFDMPKTQSNAIKVIGVGGGGGNAVNYMFQQNIKGVDFVICNTDAQALENSPIPNKVQLGASLTSGLGAGANPEVGAAAAKESLDLIEQMLQPQTKMVFITAGMGGGTGTGAAPIIAKIAKQMEILTVGIVTIPFSFEGRMRLKQAHQGVDSLRDNVDSLIVINNNKLREVYGNLGFKAGFSKADEVLATAAKGIAEVITHHYKQNIDLHDAKTVLSNSGTAIMGAAKESGAERAKNAIEKALDSPLLNDNKITGAKNVLLLIVSGSHEVTIDEIGEINDYIQNEAGHNTNIIMGIGEDEDLEDAIAVTVVATGFTPDQQSDISNSEVKKIVHSLDDKEQPAYESPEKTTEKITLDKDINKNEPKIVHTLEDEILPKQNLVHRENPSRIDNHLDDIEIIKKNEKENSSVQQGLFSVELNSEKSSEKIPLEITNQEIENKHTEENFSQKEQTDQNTQPTDTAETESEEQILHFDIKTKQSDKPEGEEQDFSPMSLTISELKKRTKQRREKMKEQNYKFANKPTKNID